MIWLQWHDNPEVTWEHEKIHDDDIEYVIASDKPNDTIDTVYQENRALEAEIKRLRAEAERLKAFIADKIHDATRERMLMEVQDE
jgi:cell division protein FtsB